MKKLFLLPLLLALGAVVASSKSHPAPSVSPSVQQANADEPVPTALVLTDAPEPTNQPIPTEIRKTDSVAGVAQMAKPQLKEQTTLTGSGNSGGDKDCNDFATQAQAQAYFTGKGGNASNNVDRLDGKDHDGIVCESLPK